MFPTAEVRWFIEGPVPPEAKRWFEAVAGTPRLEERTDRYVCPASPDGLGVKWREGKLEVKRLREIVGPARFHPRVAGRVEAWRKWSFPLTDAAELAEPAGDWIEVEKRRRVRYFSAAPGEEIRPLEDGERTAHACGLELGEVQVGEAVWWSVCLEAFGDDEAALPERLRRVAEHVTSEADPPDLPPGAALSYPAWLLRCV